jgi:hypothetical protein
MLSDFLLSGKALIVFLIEHLRKEYYLKRLPVDQLHSASP